MTNNIISKKVKFGNLNYSLADMAAVAKKQAKPELQKDQEYKNYINKGAT